MVYDGFEKNEELKISRINSAGLINLIFKDLWEGFYRSLRQLNYSRANSYLDCIWVELGGDTKDDTAQEVKDFNDIEVEIGKNFSQIPILKGFQTYSAENLKILKKQYRFLVKKAIFLKRVQNKQGKGTAYDDGSSHYMDT